jgi:hypothetical protein
MNALERRAKEAKEAEEELELDRQHHWFSLETRLFFGTVFAVLKWSVFVAIDFIALAFILRWLMQRLP